MPNRVQGNLSRNVFKKKNGHRKLPLQITKTAYPTEKYAIKEPIRRNLRMGITKQTEETKMTQKIRHVWQNIYPSRTVDVQSTSI